MARFVNIALVQDSSGTLSFMPKSPDIRPGLSGQSMFVVRVANVPDGIPDDAVRRRLMDLVNPFDPPALVDWSEMAKYG